MSVRPAITDILDFAESLQKAVDLVARTNSLEQACAESEQRLAALRSAEETSRTEADRVRALLDEQVERVNAQAEATRRAAEAEAAATRKRCADACAQEKNAAVVEVERLRNEASETRKQLVVLEDEESKLAQSVAALRAEYDSIRERLRPLI